MLKTASNTVSPLSLGDKDSRFIVVRGVSIHYKESIGLGHGHGSDSGNGTHSSEENSTSSSSAHHSSNGAHNSNGAHAQPRVTNGVHSHDTDNSASSASASSASASSSTSSEIPAAASDVQQIDGTAGTAFIDGSQYLESLSLPLPILNPTETVTSPVAAVAVAVGDSVTHSFSSVASPSAEQPALLLLHGFNGSTFNWRLLMDKMAKDVSPSTGCRVIAYDRPPFGLSERPLQWDEDSIDPYTVEAGAEFGAGLLRQLGVRKAVLCGHSAGAPVAVEIARRYPELVSGLVLVAPAISVESRGFLARADFGQLLRFGLTRAIIGSDGPGLNYIRRQVMARREAVLTGKLGVYYDEKTITPEVIEGYLLPMQADDWDKASLLVSRAFSFLEPPTLTCLTQPVLVLQGENDDVVSAATGRALAAALRKRATGITEYVELPSCGHIPMAEEQHEAPDPHFIYATSSFTARHALVDASRAWRAGLRSFIMTNDSTYVEQHSTAGAAYHEHYAHFVDDSEEAGTMRGQMSGDTRWALAPVLAHQYYQQHASDWRWMLMGDDDTLFFMHGVRKLVEHYDHNLPYLISDNVWHSSRHPSPQAPRCLPCHFDMAAVNLTTATSCLHAPAGLSQVYNGHRLWDLHHGAALCFAAGYHTSPIAECLTGNIHGGGGFLVSRALFLQLDPQLLIDHIVGMQPHSCSGSDCMLTRAIYNLLDITVTDPGYALPNDDATYTRSLVFADSYMIGKENAVIHSDPASIASKGECDGYCR
ncbi:MAG: hypothetical protein WDW36_001908 [Sanguina aurantia]